MCCRNLAAGGGGTHREWPQVQVRRGSWDDYGRAGGVRAIGCGRSRAAHLLHRWVLLLDSSACACGARLAAPPRA